MILEINEVVYFSKNFYGLLIFQILYKGVFIQFVFLVKDFKVLVGGKFGICKLWGLILKMKVGYFNNYFGKQYKGGNVFIEE